MRTLLLALLMTFVNQAIAFEANINSFPHSLEGLWVLTDDDENIRAGIIVPQYRAIKIQGDKVSIGIYFGTGSNGLRKAVEAINLDELAKNNSPLKFRENFHEMNSGKIVGQNFLGDVLVEMDQTPQSLILNRSLEVSFDNSLLSSSKVSFQLNNSGLTLNYAVGNRLFKKLNTHRSKMVTLLGIFLNTNIFELDKDIDKFLIHSRSSPDNLFPIIGIRSCAPVSAEILESMSDFNFALRWVIAWKANNLDQLLEYYLHLLDEVNINSIIKFVDIKDPQTRTTIQNASLLNDLNVEGLFSTIDYQEKKKIAALLFTDNGVPDEVESLGKAFLSQIVFKDRSEALSMVVSALAPGPVGADKELEESLWIRFGTDREIGKIKSPYETWLDLSKFVVNGEYSPNCT